MHDTDAGNIYPLFSIGQIRLAELSVYNWGSFHGLHTALIDPHGTLVTGDNGAGKSTFIDGLMALLLPAGRATFNMAAAQGDRSDRTLLSYMRGSFGSMHDGSGTRVKSKRDKAVVTGLRALYRGDDGSCMTLACIFWMTQASNALSDVKRIYCVAKRNLSLKEMLDAFGEGNARSLKQWLRNDPAITCCDDSFSDYQELYRKLLYMDNRNAPALLSRALGLKKIDDLTGLIRELVLEPSTIKDDARRVVDEFADLVAIHNQLLDARQQKEHLSRLPDLQQTMKRAENELNALARERASLPVYFGKICYDLWTGKITRLQASFDDLSFLIKQLAQQEQESESLKDQRYAEYLEAGGERVESLKKELGDAQQRLNQITLRAASYQKDVQNLDLEPGLEEKLFLVNQQLAEHKLANIGSEKQAAQNLFGQLTADWSNHNQRKTALNHEIEEISARPDSNIELNYQQLRDELAASLGLAKDQCIFIGELIDVDERQRHWQGAIERALGGLRTTLAVPAEQFPMVTRWLNTRHTGLHVRVQVVRDTDSHERAEFKANGFLNKLVWREHPYREWLKTHLARFDLQCVSSTEELDNTPFSMTEQGLIHFDKGRFEKKDQHKIDDRRRWQLGFSNKSRLVLLQNDLTETGQMVGELYKAVENARLELNRVGEREAIWNRILAYSWEEINAPKWHARVERLRQDIALLELGGNALETAMRRLEEVRLALAGIRNQIVEANRQEAELSRTLSDARHKQDQALEAARSGMADEVRDLLAKRVGLLLESDLENAVSLQGKHDRDIENLHEKARNKQFEAEKRAIGIMSAFRSHDKWRVVAEDWGSDAASLEEYLKHLRQLEEEGLPNLVEQFVERLNKHATQSLARIDQRLDSERDDINERIGTINQVLARTEFRPGSHLKLGSKGEPYPHIQDFKRKVRTVLSQASSEDHEARFEQLKAVVEILEKASNPATANTLESLRLLDPRYQMSFYAEELDTETREVRDVLESSSGKSGGEKESFAGAIVAASLSYVLTPNGYDRPVYCTVFLDEAFSNTAEAVSRRVLRVFKELHIHVNLITPYKNLNLARESARSLLIAERDQDNHESRLCEVTWEEIDQRLEQQRRQKLGMEAQALGVELENG
ncbi:MAG: ATP-binding protein [Methylococcales bacterium]|nr:ATP-binding protein [Methylococcales bacterium]